MRNIESYVFPHYQIDRRKANRFCSELNGWSEPDLFKCTSLSFVKLAEQLTNLQNGLLELNTSLVVAYAHQLQTAVNKTFPLYGNDVLIFSLFFHNIILHEKQKAGLDLSHRQDRYFIKNLVQAADVVLDPIYMDHWNEIAASTGRGIEMIMNSFEEYLRFWELTLFHQLMYGLTLKMRQKYLDVSPFVEFYVNDGTEIPSVIFPKYNNYPIRENVESLSAEIIIPFNSIGIDKFDDSQNTHGGSGKEVAVLGYVIYSTLGQLYHNRLTVQLVYTKHSINSCKHELLVNLMVFCSYHGIPIGVNAPVLTAVVQSINTSENTGQTPGARLRFRIFNSTGTSPQCVFWNHREKRGEWSSEGCEVESYRHDSPYINCSCSHLSSFTVIMEKNHNEFLPSESLVQNVISYLAIITSLILLACTFLVFCLLRGSQTNSNRIHICLVFCIFAAELIFLIALKSRHSLVFQQITLLVFISALKSSLQCKDSVMDFGNLKTLLWLAVILLPIQGSTWVLAILSVNETHTILQYAFSFFLPARRNLYLCWLLCGKQKDSAADPCYVEKISQKKKKYPEMNGIQSALQPSAAYPPSSKIYHRSIGISTSSATSRSTSKTCASHCRTGSEPKLSENQPSTSECDGMTTDKGIYCKHGKYYEQIIRNCDTEQCTESTSSGPKMGVNVFSYPRLPGSRSPLSKTSLSLKMGLNSKDHSLSWGSVDSQKSSPLSAPISSGVRAEFYTPRMGVSGIEKSIHSARDIYADSNSLDSNLHLSSVNKLDFKTGICSSCKSQSLSKDTLSDFSSSDLPQPDSYSKSPHKGHPHENKKRVRLSKEKGFYANDTPSEEESPLNITLKHFQNGSSSNDSNCEYNNQFKRHSKTAPPFGYC
ncbi:protocadherin-like wing polarity protein stan [Caerostris extrusa]|uniref:Protocadherin-like wing polarity protein stan n=1 Tax=Caerostris extrusa TaxID=172846 RepID=A0AAV4XVG4_CAEEX|nr:protocadherin-like wing polarity protein stan [Caerostris extrusa]